MKKSLIFKILYLFLVLIVVAGASVFATNTYLSARDISYGSTNVEDALNGLFTLKGNDENYSTDERIVGKWIDGKPLYRKVIFNNTLKSITARTWTNYYLATELNIESLVNGTFGRVEADSIKRDIMNDVNIWYNVSSKYIEVHRESSGLTINSGSFLIIEYTKTTDNTINN